MQCPQCQHANRDAARFCAACASPLGTTCVACGNPNPTGAAYCDICATPLITNTAASSPSPPAQRGGAAERRFQVLLLAVIGLLQGQKRVPYRMLTYTLGLDEVVLEEIREELSFRQLAMDEDGKGLVWTAAPPLPPVAAGTSTPATVATTASDGGPAVMTDATGPDVPPADEPVAPELIRRPHQGERRRPGHVPYRHA